jgi:hypothetical protein
MTVVEKLSDRNNLIFEAIKLLLVNEGSMDHKQIQYRLFCCGIYIKKELLLQAMSVMKEKGLITKPNAEKASQENGKETEKAESAKA